MIFNMVAAGKKDMVITTNSNNWKHKQVWQFYPDSVPGDYYVFVMGCDSPYNLDFNQSATLAGYNKITYQSSNITTVSETVFGFGKIFKLRFSNVGPTEQVSAYYAQQLTAAGFIMVYVIGPGTVAEV